MSNGRSSVFRRAGKAAGKYSASQERGRGIESAKAGAAALSQLNIDTMFEKTNVIGEGIGLASALSDTSLSKKETTKAVEGMKATEKKQTPWEWAVGAEKEYTTTDNKGKEVDWTQSTLKAGWGAKQTKYAEGYDPDKAKSPSKAKSPTMLEEATQPKKSKGFIGEEKGIDTKTKDWFKNLFGGADQETTGDNVLNNADPNAPDGSKKPPIPKFDPKVDYKKQLESTGILESKSQPYGPQLPSQGMIGSQANPYTGEFKGIGGAYSQAKKSTGGQGTFWWESEQGESKEYGF